MSPDILDATRPRVTIAVCTRDRPRELDRCLQSLRAIEAPDSEVVVVDNAPSDGRTEALVRSGYPSTRYVREPRPGLNRARNRAIEVGRGAILAFTDDDAVVSPGWTDALLDIFDAHPETMAVTGPVEALELVTQAQRYFDAYGGFGAEAEPRVYRRRPDTPGPVLFGWATECGTGANMAFRRCIFDDIGDFDPALGAGTPTAGGDELDMFYRTLRAGHEIRYEPRAVVRHPHRPDLPGLRSQTREWGTALTAFLARTADCFPSDRADAIRFGLRWLVWQGRRLLSWSPGFPRTLVVDEIRGAAAGISAYRRSVRERDDDPGQRGPREPDEGEACPGST